MTLCLALPIGATSGCDPSEKGPAEPLASTADNEQAALTAAPAVHLPGLVPGAKLDSRQLAAIGPLDQHTIGQACSNAFQPCEPPFNAIVRDCGGFTDVCDSTGTEDILPINVLCLPTATGNVCTAIAGQNQQTIACTVPTDGKACSTGCGGSFCAPYRSECAVQTNLVQDCFSGGHCASDSCQNQTVTEQVVGTCTRETEGDSCHLVNGSECQFPKAPICAVNHVCACLLGPQ